MVVCCNWIAGRPGPQNLGSTPNATIDFTAEVKSAAETSKPIFTRINGHVVELAYTLALGTSASA